MTFKLDTGAEVTAVSKKYQNLGAPRLEQSTKVLYGPTSEALKAVCQFKKMLSTDVMEIRQESLSMWYCARSQNQFAWSAIETACDQS